MMAIRREVLQEILKSPKLTEILNVAETTEQVAQFFEWYCRLKGKQVVYVKN